MKTVIDALQGTWNIVSIEVEGQKYPPAGAQIVVSGERFVSLNMGAGFEGTIRFDESATPRTVDLLYESAAEALDEMANDILHSGRPADAAEYGVYGEPGFRG